MGRANARTLYLLLLRLHTSSFRYRFGGEMLEAFDEAFEVYGAVWLLRDAALSVVRQRMFRRGLAASQECANLLAGTYPEIRATHLTFGKLSAALWLSLMSLFLFPPDVPVPHRQAATKAPVGLEVRYAKAR